MMDAVKKHVYITVNGREVEYQAISLDTLRLSWVGIEKQYRERGEPIDPPTYEFETGSGAKITEPHDATTLTTDEDKKAWAAYQDAIGRMQYDKSLMQMRYIYDDGLESVRLPEDDSWLEKHRKRHIDIPEDPQELREFYITAEVLKSNADIAGIVSVVMLLSQQGKVDEAALETALDSFLGYMGRQAIKRTVNRQKQVETQPETI